eukprot:11688981-Ditylum_brightwellii.AAC.1
MARSRALLITPLIHLLTLGGNWKNRVVESEMSQATEDREVTPKTKTLRKSNPTGVISEPVETENSVTPEICTNRLMRMTRNQTAIQAQEITGNFIVTTPKSGNSQLAEQRGAALKALTGGNHGTNTKNNVA